jgi:streptogramin lyase
MWSKNPLLRALIASATALALLPAAAASAASVRTIALNAPGFGVATDGAGRVHVIESDTQSDAIFNADGTLFQRVTLPGPAGSAENAVRAADGSVWVAIDPTNNTGGLARVGTDGAVTSVPTTTLTSCGPVGLTAAGNAIAFTSYAFTDGATNCSNGGVGVVNGTTPSMLSTTENRGYGLAFAGGSLFVGDYDGDQIHRLNADGSIAAHITTPPASGPDQLVAGPDGNVWATLFNTGQVARFAPTAAGGSAASVVGQGLNAPGGLQVGPYGQIDVADNGNGRVLSIDPAGGPSTAIPLPGGFAPRQLARSGNELWVTDDDAARVAVVTDDTPVAAVTAGSATAATVTVEPRGNDTRIVVSAAQPGQPLATTAALIVPGSIRSTTAPLPFRPVLPAGDWTLVAHASNARGTIDSAPITIHVAGAPQTAPGPGGTTNPGGIAQRTPRARAPKFAELVSVVPTRRCVANRRILLLRLRKQPPARTIAWVIVRVGKHKARKYLARQLKHGLQLRNLPAHGAFRLAVTVRLANTKTYSKSLTFKACKVKRH